MNVVSIVIFQQSCDPYFLTTVVFPEGSVNEMTRLKLAVFDVRDREKEEVYSCSEEEKKLITSAWPFHTARGLFFSLNEYGRCLVVEIS